MSSKMFCDECGREKHNDFDRWLIVLYDIDCHDFCSPKCAIVRLEREARKQLTETRMIEKVDIKSIDIPRPEGFLTGRTKP